MEIKIKRLIVLGLVCLNLALVAVLAFGVTAPKAQAQTRGRGADYVAITGHISSDEDVVYVIDTNSRRLACWTLDKTTKRLTMFKGRDLDRDFNASR